MGERYAVDPFPADDPLDYGELSPEAAALRALLAVLADTGATVLYPPEFAPSCVPMMIAAGWRLQPKVRPASELPCLLADADKVRLSATWVMTWDRAVGWPRCACLGRAAPPHPPRSPGCIAVVEPVDAGRPEGESHV